MTQTNISSLICEEVLDSNLCNKTPERSTISEDWIQWESPITVKAIQDHSQIKDVRILQNLLRNEDRFLPEIPDYMKTLQVSFIYFHSSALTQFPKKNVYKPKLQTFLPMTF